MIERISQIPVLRIIILCTIGYFISTLLVLPSKYIFYILISSLIVGIMLLYFKKNFISLIVICFSIGFWFANQIENIKSPAPDKIIGEFPAIFDGKISEILRYDSNKARIILKGNIDTKFLPEIKRTSILLNIYGDKTGVYNLKNGHFITAKLNARLPSKRILKEDFDEALYCSSLGVQWVGRARIEDISIVDIQEKNDYFKDIKEKISNIISILFSDNPEAVINAMILGDKSLISNELKEVFSLSGTAHLLAVSGLHVGIIAFFIFFLLSFIRQKWLKFIIFSALTISYVIISGMHESAIRAGFMSILVVFLITIERQIYPLNLMLFVFFILVIIKPSFIYSAGFQMSFAAIGGIILFFKPIKNFFDRLIKSENKLINKILSSFALTISASIIVSPIVAYYFGVYSVVSPISNLVVVPLMSLSLIFGVISIALSFINIQIAEIYALTTTFLLNLSEEINRFSISLPFAYWKNLESFWVIALLSLITLYLISCRNIKQFVFRLVVSVLIFLFSYYLLLPEAEFKIIPRDKYVILMTNDIYKEKIVIIIDRKPHQKYAYDSGLIKYIRSSDKDFIIAYNGLAGSSIIDKIKKIKHVKTIELNNQDVRLIKKILNLNEHIPKLI
jgi:competence protein ComEC